MATQELELVGEERLVRGAVVYVEVADAGIGTQLAPGRPPRRGDRRAGPGDAVGLTDADEPRAVQPAGVASRPVWAPEQPARGDAVAPARILADRDHVSPALLPAGRVDQRRLVGPADGREVLAPCRGGQHPRGHQR